MSMLKNITFIKLLLCAVAFCAGLGIEFPLINIFGNVTIADIFLLVYSLILFKYLNVHYLTYFPILIGIAGLISIGYNTFITTSYHQVELAGFPIIFRWMYYGFIICVFYTYCRDIEDLNLYFYSLLLGVLFLLVYSWYNWTSELRYFFGFPVLAWIEELNANTLGFYFCSSLPILILLQKHKYLKSLSFFVILILILVSIISTISKAAILTAVFVVVLSTKIRLSSLIGYGIFASTLIYGLGDLALKRWSASQGSNQDRITLISNAQEMFLSSPLLGIGPKAYSTTRLTKVSDAHNVFFNILAEYGIIGITLYIAFVICILLFVVPKVMKFSYDLGYFVLIYIISIQMLGMTTGLAYSDKISWIVIGCILGVVKHSTCNEHNHPFKNN